MALTPAWQAISTLSPQEKGKKASLARTDPCVCVYVHTSRRSQGKEPAAFGQTEA